MSAGARDVLIAAAVKELGWLWQSGTPERCSRGEYHSPPSPEECFANVADAQLGALVEAGYLVVHESDTDEGCAAAQVDPGGKHDAWLEARNEPHG